MNYSKRDKARAVRLYVKHGADHAAAEVGCSVASIYRWLAEVEGEPRTERAVTLRAATAERLTEKRKALCEALADTALDLATAARGAKAVDAKNLMIAAGIAAQRHLELAGVGTEGHGLEDRGVPSREKVQGWIRELDRRKPTIDHELEKAFAEFSRAVEHGARHGEGSDNGGSPRLRAVGQDAADEP